MRRNGKRGAVIASLDARYDQERKVCVCGCDWFVQLTPVEVHALPEVTWKRPAGAATLQCLPLCQDTDAQREANACLPIAECIQCRTRYDRLWREVV